MSESDMAFVERMEATAAFPMSQFDDCERLFALARRGAEAADEIERLRAALTPSVETKAAYIGEFHFVEEELDDEGNSVTRNRTVPWATVKEIMAAIRARAALRPTDP